MNDIVVSPSTETPPTLPSSNTGSSDLNQAVGIFNDTAVAYANPNNTFTNSGQAPVTNPPRSAENIYDRLNQVVGLTVDGVDQQIAVKDELIKLYNVDAAAFDKRLLAMIAQARQDGIVGASNGASAHVITGVTHNFGIGQELVAKALTGQQMNIAATPAPVNPGHPSSAHTVPPSTQNAAAVQQVATPSRPAAEAPPRAAPQRLELDVAPVPRRTPVTTATAVAATTPTVTATPVAPNTSTSNAYTGAQIAAVLKGLKLSDINNSGVITTDEVKQIEAKYGSANFTAILDYMATQRHTMTEAEQLLLITATRATETLALLDISGGNSASSQVKAAAVQKASILNQGLDFVEKGSLENDRVLVAHGLKMLLNWEDFIV